MKATGNVLLDTSVVIAHLRRDPDLTAHLADVATFVPWVVLGELHYGVERARRRKEALSPILEFLGIAALLLPDRDTAEQYGRIKAELAEKGTLIPDNDIWIAALARQHDMPLATRDRHFSAVQQLKILDW